MVTESVAAKADCDLGRGAWPRNEAALASLSPDRWSITLARLNEQAPARRRAFEAAAPFPHVVIDGLFDDDLLDGIAAEFPDLDDGGWHASTSPDGGCSPWAPVGDLGGPLTHILVQRMNSTPFINCLTAISGFHALIGESHPTLQQSRPGNRLGAHVDGIKTAQRGLYLRLTTMLFLNRDWSESDAGNFELWDKDSSACVESIAPLFNRLVIFVNTDNSYHGFPRPMQGPAGARRRSILLRYLSANVPEKKRAAPDKRNFGPRDRPPRSNTLRTVLHRITPPILVDLARKMR
jgi:hypothetical protein